MLETASSAIVKRQNKWSRRANQPMSMTKQEQKTFVRELIANVRADLLKQSKLIPPEWDGHELRQWIADTFQESSYTLRQDKRRYKAYRNAVACMGRL